MRFKPKGVILGLIGGLIGALISLSPWALKLEEDTGLEWLFHQRGSAPPPAEIVIISIDKRSADQLGVPGEPEQWPRQLHAQLVELLNDAEVTSITFDMLFKTARDPVQDHAFARAVASANNVILFEFVQKELINDTTDDPSITIRRRIPPIAPLIDAAVALAPFALPKVPLKVSQFWRFAPDAGDAPTLPTTTLQLYTLAAYDDFRALLQQVAPQHLKSLPTDQQTIIQHGALVPFIHQLKRLFADHPTLLPGLTKAAQHAANTLQHKARLLAFLRIYDEPHSLYLNYYGPPRTITTIPFHQIIQSDSHPEYRAQLENLKDKIIFVGYSAELQWEQKDGFYSVFSRADGLDISGVEIAATATANLLHGNAIQPLSPIMQFLILLLWGLIIGMAACRLPALIAILVTLMLAGCYFISSLFLFSQSALWLPLLIPLLLQLPLILFSCVIWKHLASLQERHNIHKAFRNYLPEKEIDRMTSDDAQQTPSSERYYGICLFTDAAQYTQLSEQMSPDELSQLMNRYYETIFATIQHHHGIISDVVGDAMMALWPSAAASSELRHAACCAAIDLLDAVEHFNQQHPSHQLPTRIGIHCGEIMLGNVGAVGRLEYRATGDVVNTTSRIEGMNKLFGTRLLVSDNLLCDQNTFLTRTIGTFILAGKSRPITLHELLCHRNHATETQHQLCTQFNAALKLFTAAKWPEAAAHFSEIATTHQDRASDYYYHLCQTFAHSPPDLPWKGVINIETK